MAIPTLAELGVNHYGDPLREARQCRRASALFDFSFMSRFRVSGPGALAHLNSVQSRDLSGMRSGDIRYALCAGTDGAVGSDLTVWKLGDESYDVYSGRPQDIDGFGKELPEGCELRDLTDSTWVYSVQGPDSLAALSAIGNRDELVSLGYFQHGETRIGDIPCRVGRLGYTGEKGFEIVVNGHAAAERAWRLLLGVAPPAGVAAMDTLRIEAGFILFLNECRLGFNAAELGLGKFAGIDRVPARHRLVCFRARATDIDMPWSPPVDIQKPAGGEIAVTSAAFSGICEGILGLGFIKAPEVSGTTYTDTMGGFHGIELVGLPFHDPGKSIPRADW